MLLESAKKARSNESGFTLIELLIVIVILGILAAIVVFAIGGITNRGYAASCKSDVKTVEVAQEAYFAEHGVYAANAGALVPEFLHSAPNPAPNADQRWGVTTDNSGVVTANPANCAGL